MATTPTTPGPTPVLPTLADALGNGIKLDISGTFPGETVITALINYANTVRTTMDPALLKRLDAVIVQQIEDIQSVNRNLWKLLGVVQ